MTVRELLVAIANEVVENGAEILDKEVICGGADSDSMEEVASVHFECNYYESPVLAIYGAEAEENEYYVTLYDENGNEHCVYLIEARNYIEAYEYCKQYGCAFRIEEVG